MKYKKALFEDLKNFPFFEKEKVATKVARAGLSSHSVDSYLKDKNIIRLKRNLYVHRETFKEEKSDFSYNFYIANKLRTPSYISLQSGLQYYGMMTETIVTTITSVTAAVTRSYNTPLGKFTYRTIRRNLFDFYELITGSNYPFLIATNFKCLFDTLYFYSNRFRHKINNGIFDQLRLDLSEFSLRDRARFNKLIGPFPKAEIKL